MCLWKTISEIRIHKFLNATLIFRIFEQSLISLNNKCAKLTIVRILFFFVVSIYHVFKTVNTTILKFNISKKLFFRSIMNEISCFVSRFFFYSSSSSWTKTKFVKNFEKKCSKLNSENSLKLSKIFVCSIDDILEF